MANNKIIVTILRPAKDFIYSFDEVIFARILRTITLLEDFGIELRMPHSKKIDKDIYELRIRGKQEIRIFYAFVKGKIFLLHGFIKKSDKIPRKEIELARERLRGLTN